MYICLEFGPDYEEAMNGLISAYPNYTEVHVFCLVLCVYIYICCLCVLCEYVCICVCLEFGPDYEEAINGLISAYPNYTEVYMYAYI